jgi:hypothetical protein
LVYFKQTGTSRNDIFYSAKGVLIDIVLVLVGFDGQRMSQFPNRKDLYCKYCPLEGFQGNVSVIGGLFIDPVYGLAVGVVNFLR